MSQSALKLLALVSMLLDHTAKTVLNTGVLVPYVGSETSLLIRNLMVALGRMAFPMFAWFTAEGCRRTSSPQRYLLRLLVFAILSEVPFQLDFHQRLSFGCHNVIFTMLLAAAAVFLGRALRKYGVPAPWAQLVPACAAIALGWFLYTDYNAWGVALVLGLYYLPTIDGRLIYLTLWNTVFQLIWHGWSNGRLIWLYPSGRFQLLHWLGAMLSVVFLAIYNGEKGMRSKWLFYVFYPSHLLALYGLTQWIVN